MNSRRPTCPRCDRPQRTCLCPLVVPVANQVPVRLLQHPLEEHQAKGSARLLGLCLTRFDCQVGEHIAPENLADWLAKPPEVAGTPATLLLYPDTGDGAPLWPGPADASPFKPPQNPRPSHPAQPPQPPPPQPPALQLLVIDATWRKSRKMLALNPQLATLPRLALPPQTLNRYAALRKAQRPGQLSTLEATALALGWLEAEPERYAPLLAAFEGFVAAQGAWRA